MSDAPSEADGERDVLLVQGASEHGGYHVVRSREDRIEVGELRHVREGQPIVGELVKLTPNEAHSQVFDVEVLMEAPKTAGATGRQLAHAGPAKVASNAYRSGWDSIFGAGGSGGSGDDQPN